MCVFCNVWVFDNCVGVLVICVLEFTVFVLFLLCFCFGYLVIFILICFVHTSVRTNATK